jgi:hypothetical protein
MTLSDDDASEDKLVKALMGEAVKGVFGRYADVGDFDGIIEHFKGNLTFPAGDELSGEEFVANMKAVPGLAKAAAKLGKELDLVVDEPLHLAAAGEFLLEALYVNDRLSKFNQKGKSFFKR